MKTSFSDTPSSYLHGHYDFTGLIEDLGEESIPAVVESFLDDAGGLVHTLIPAVNHGDMDKTAGCAHQLKSTSAFLGAAHFRSLSLKMETAAKAGETEQCARLLPPFLDEYEALKSGLQAYLSTHPV